MNVASRSMEGLDYLEKNRLAWNQRVDVHIGSAFYDNGSFLSGESTLNAPELGLLGDVAGKSVLHLQCHFGQDSISLARMGAAVTAVDLSDKAIERGRAFAEETGQAVEFIGSDVYGLPDCLRGQYDVVFTTYGTIGWLPDLDRWGAVIAHFLKPGGEFIFVEFHPVLWMFDADFTRVDHGYANAGAIVEQVSGTYADPDAPLQLEEVSWNHGIGEVLQGLIGNGLEIVSFEEFDYSPYPCFKHLVEDGPGRFRIKHLAGKLPMMYALKAMKKGLA